MTETGEKPTHAQAAAAARAARLAEELRANLRKRKEKARMTEAPADTKDKPSAGNKRID
jgi:D-Tyr-tRNAtyr deacylase